MDVLKVLLSSWKTILAIMNVILIIFEFSETLMHWSTVKNTCYETGMFQALHVYLADIHLMPNTNLPPR